jgi:hypothetical protein
MEIKLDQWLRSRLTDLRKRLINDRWLLRDLAIGIVVLLIAEFIATLIRAGGFMYSQGFWDYQFLGQYLTISIPSIILTIGTLVFGIYFFCFAIVGVLRKSRGFAVKSYRSWWQWLLVVIGLACVSIFSWWVPFHISESATVLELIFLSFAYLCRIVASTRLVGLFFCFIASTLFVITVFFSSFNHPEFYASLLSDIKLSDWTIKLHSIKANEPSSIEQCLTLLSSDTIWTRDILSDTNHILSSPRSGYSIQYIKKHCE